MKISEKHIAQIIHRPFAALHSDFNTHFLSAPSNFPFTDFFKVVVAFVSPMKQHDWPIWNSKTAKKKKYFTIAFPFCEIERRKIV